MQGYSFIHTGLNFVLYVAAPESFLDFLGLGGDIDMSRRSESYSELLTVLSLSNPE